MTTKLGRIVTQSNLLLPVKVVPGEKVANFSKMSVASFCNPYSGEMLSQNSWSKVTPKSKCLHGETQNFNESFNVI